MAKQQLTCLDCGCTAPAGSHTPGSFAIEIVLWLCFLVPGIIYTLWRHSAQKPSCKSCGGTTLVPANSPRARQMQSTGMAQLPGPPPPSISMKARALWIVGAVFAFPLILTGGVKLMAWLTGDL